MAEVDEKTKQVVTRLFEAAQKYGDAANADVMLYSGDLRSPFDEQVVRLCRERGKRRPTVLLILCTYGGIAHVAYRIGRCLQRHYDRFEILIVGYCKSAGTLLAMGAHSLLLWEHAELGPLDVQVRSKDELGERSSGLAPQQALMTLEERTFSMFRRKFLDLRLKLQLTTRTAAEIATELATGVYQPIFAQIDPMRVGEMERATQIAIEYGRRLAEKSSNVKPDALERLVAGYPSHEFVIDAEEAKTLFNDVKELTPEGQELARLAEEIAKNPIDGDGDPAIFFMNDGVGENEQRSEDTAPAEPGTAREDQNRPGGTNGPPDRADGGPEYRA